MRRFSLTFEPKLKIFWKANNNLFIQAELKERLTPTQYLVTQEHQTEKYAKHNWLFQSLLTFGNYILFQAIQQQVLQAPREGCLHMRRLQHPPLLQRDQVRLRVRVAVLLWHHWQKEDPAEEGCFRRFGFKTNSRNFIISSLVMPYNKRKWNC